MSLDPELQGLVGQYHYDYKQNSGTQFHSNNFIKVDKDKGWPGAA